MFNIYLVSGIYILYSLYKALKHCKLIYGLINPLYSKPNFFTCMLLTFKFFINLVPNAGAFPP